jgi:2-polyprenyl-3-methyl-5-hydroxy-6-metoxy-1,4-benzoquinol methylase
MLDIGSGLAVFTALLKNQNWQTSIIDPDPVAIQHAHNQSATHHTLNAQFPSNTLTITQSLPAPFSLISLNKVLEHNLNPVPILQAVLPLLHTHGLVYIELPDAENALLSKLAHMRNEFFLEHFHAFSFSSINALIHQAGFFPLQIERILEPSGKYTLFAFMTPQASKIS